MPILEKTFIDALLHAVQEPSEETRHVATASLEELLKMYQEETLAKVAAVTSKAAASAEV
jgi:hypothetical protein